jgi:hypothetical protein
MADTLDYATPPAANARLSNLTLAIFASLVVHFLVFSLYAPSLDGGRRLRMCAVVSAGYWLVVLMIVLRRRRRLSKVDLAFVATGYPLLLFPCIFAATGEL